MNKMGDEMFEIYFRKTGKVVGKPYKCMKRARMRVDALDNAYGCYAYGIRQVTEVV